MSIARVPGDTELDFLFSCTKEELEPLVKILLNAATNWLDIDTDYKLYHPDHTKYVDAIIGDFQRFGGNTFANMVRGWGVPYREILEDVCDNQKIKFSKSSTTEEIENALIEKTLSDMWAQLTEEQRREILEELGKDSKKFNLLGTGTSSLLTLFRMGGFESYKVSVMLANGLAKMLLGRGLAFGANAALTRTLSIVTGPIGWAVGGIWTAFDIASPAMRVVVPFTVWVANLRPLKKHAKEVGEDIKSCIASGDFAKCKMFS